MTRDAPENLSLPDLWDAAKHLLRWLYAVCGSPCALLAEVHLSPKERRQIAFWLRPVEALVRRLLVVEAAHIAATAKPVRKTIKRSLPHYPFCRVAFPDPGTPAGWAVRFSMIGAPPARTSATGRVFTASGNRTPPAARVPRSGRTALRRSDV